MELEDLKTSWKEMDKHIDRLEDNNEITRKVMKERIVSVQRRLALRFRTMTVLCLLAPSFLNLSDFGLDELGVWVKGGFLAFFILMAIHKGILWIRMSKLNFMQMTGKEALISTYKLEKFQKAGVLVGLPCGLVLIALFMVELYRLQEMFALLGAWCGLVVGIIAGLRLRKRVRKEFQQLRVTLEDELNCVP